MDSLDISQRSGLSWRLDGDADDGSQDLSQGSARNDDGAPIVFGQPIHPVDDAERRSKGSSRSLNSSFTSRPFPSFVDEDDASIVFDQPIHPVADAEQLSKGSRSLNSSFASRPLPEDARGGGGSNNSSFSNLFAEVQNDGNTDKPRAEEEGETSRTESSGSPAMDGADEEAKASAWSPLLDELLDASPPPTGEEAAMQLVSDILGGTAQDAPAEDVVERLVSEILEGGESKGELLPGAAPEAPTDETVQLASDIFVQHQVCVQLVSEDEGRPNCSSPDSLDDRSGARAVSGPSDAGPSSDTEGQPSTGDDRSGTQAMSGQSDAGPSSDTDGGQQSTCERDGPSADGRSQGGQSKSESEGPSSDTDSSAMPFNQLFGEILQGFREKRHYDDQDGADAGAMPFSQLFGEILQGFREKRHYDDQDATSPSNCSTPSVSPTPLAPEVEQRLKEARLSHLSLRPEVETVHPQQANATHAAAPIPEAGPGKASTQPSPSIVDTGSHLPPDASQRALQQLLRDEQALHLPPDASQLARLHVPQAQPQARHSLPQVAEAELPRALAGTSTDAAASKEQGAAKSAAKKPKANARRGTKRKDGEQPTATINEAPQVQAVVGMGFFSQMHAQGLYGAVVGSTGAKKKRKKPAKRKPKEDPLAGIGMGFFSGQMGASNGEPRAELSERIKPLYNWAPDLDDRARAASEFSLPLVLPAVALLSKYSSFAWVYCFALPILHTLEVLFTNFGPNSLHFKWAPITPMAHMCIDLCLLHPMCMLAFMYPEAFGKYAYVHGSVLFLLEYIYWAVAYKYVVVRRHTSKDKIS